MRHTPFRLPTVLSGSLAVAAMLTLSACGGNDGPATDPATSPPVSNSSTPIPSPSSAQSPTQAGTDTPSSGSTEVPAAAGTVPVHYVGPHNKLFPYPAAAAADPVSILAALSATPADPDYTSLWSPGTLTSLTVTGKRATVDLSSRAGSGDAATGKVAVQQLAWTLQSTLGVTAIVFTIDGQPTTSVLGHRVSVPEKARDFATFLSLVTISSPLEGAQVSGGFTASGTSNGVEAWTGWQLIDAQDKVVKAGFTTAEGWMDKLYPWQATVDLADVAPGTYTFRAYLDDPSGGEGGKPVDEDTRTVIVK